MAKSPFADVQEKVVVKGGAVVYEMTLPRLEQIAQRAGLHIVGQHVFQAPVVVKLDGWPDDQFGKRLFLRIGAQGVGCTLTCHGCDAADLPGYNLTADEMAFQAIEALLRVDLGKTEHLTIAFMGTGETGYNLEVENAIVRLDYLLDYHPHFIVSSSGGFYLPKLVDKLVELLQAGVDVDLQLSLNYPTQSTRLGYLRDNVAANGKPKKTLTVLQLAEIVRHWHALTGRRVHLGCVVGEQFFGWTGDDYEALAALFSPDTCMIKLSVEGKKQCRCEAEIAKRRQILEEMGYAVYVYDPVGNSLGAGCASLETIEE